MPHVDITLRWAAPPLTFLVNQHALTLTVAAHTVAPHHLRPDNLIEPLPPNLLADPNLDLAELDTWLIGRMPKIRTSMAAGLSQIYLHRYDAPLRPEHSAVVTLKEGCILRPSLHRLGAEDDTYVLIRPSHEDDPQIAAYVRPCAENTKELELHFAAASLLVPPLIIDPDPAMTMPVDLPESLPRGTRIIPARKVRAGTTLVGVPVGAVGTTVRLVVLDARWKVRDSRAQQLPDGSASQRLAIADPPSPGTTALEYRSNFPVAVLN